MQKVPKSGTFRKISLKMGPVRDIKLLDWIGKLQSYGINAFSKELMEKELPGYSRVAFKRALSRLSDQKKIFSVYKGYYIIISPQFSARGILPPALFIDGLMEYLQRPYYVALLSAAAIHGAAHYQPQEFFVVTTYPQIRQTRKKGLVINYIPVIQFPVNLTESRKTESGYIQVSGPILTASDLIQYEKRIGGINRAATVISELSEVIRTEDISLHLINHVPVTVLQRLGYIFEFVCNRTDLANELFTSIMKSKKIMYRNPLKPSVKVKGFFSDNRWKIIKNLEINTDI